MNTPKAASVVADCIRAGIASGETSPGDVLPSESQLAELHGVSRPVVREALRILESESLISIRRGSSGGARILVPSVSAAARQIGLVLRVRDVTLADLMEARAHFEPFMVRQLARHRDPRLIARLRAHNDETTTLIGDRARYPRHATRFHHLLVELTENRTLAAMGQTLMEIVEAHEFSTFLGLGPHDVVDVAASASASHGAVIDMIEAGEADAAEAHWLQHLEEITAISLSRLGAETVVSIPEGRRAQAPL
ncbi:MAG: FadR/GntR family transcriptional regulator [Acidimicrobiia bacterium]